MKSTAKRKDEGTLRETLRPIAITMALAIVVGVAAVVPARAQSKGPAPVLTAQDRAEIQDLVAAYAKALGTCADEAYADLFEPDGYFGSGIRGAVFGRQRLIALVRSERHCNPSTASSAPGESAAAAPRPINVPTAIVEATPDGVVGRASLGNAGHYEDAYVKTPKEWRFKARDVFTPQEEAAKLTAEDLRQIRHLAGNDRGYFDDVYVATPDGKRFRSSGLTTAVTPEGVKGTAYLKGDGGHYEDVYVRIGDGWRFKSRLYMPPAPVVPASGASSSR